jgi:conjugative relaxase-like TrwC/TraI family protein
MNGKDLSHHPGLHFAFTVSKSYSIKILGEGKKGEFYIKEPELYVAYQRAVHRALDRLQEKHIYIRTGQNQPEQRADNGVFACFTEFENNEGERHLHTHVMWFNLTHHKDKWRAINRPQYWAGQNNRRESVSQCLDYYMGAEAEALGYKLRRNGRGADLACVSRAEILQNSTRSAKLRKRENELAKTNLPAKTVKELAYRQTRKKRKKAPIREKRPQLVPYGADNEDAESRELLKQMELGP